MGDIQAGRFHDFTLSEAMEVARRCDPGPLVPSVSRTLLAEIERLLAERDALAARLAAIDAARGEG